MAGTAVLQPLPTKRWSLPTEASSRMVSVSLVEWQGLRARLGTHALNHLLHQVERTLLGAMPGSRSLGSDRSGSLLLTFPSSSRHLEQRLGRALAQVLATPYLVCGETFRVTPALGHARLRGVTPEQAESRATLAMKAAESRRDLVPVGWSTKLAAPAPSALRLPALAYAMAGRLRTPLQVLATFALGVGLPYLGYVLSERLALLHVAMTTAYIIVVVGMTGTVAALIIEGLLALDPQRPPAQAGGPSPKATAIIAAYLPNESATIVATVEAFLALDYPAGLQIIVAYNTPSPLPVEQSLAELAALDPRLLVLPVAGSTSKAQNVNTALAEVTGHIVGLFDADHHPDPGCFERAWLWLSNGYGVVQGHCVVRNGDASWVTRMVAVEFESIYAVSHPGRSELHGNGIFGGSNGYWQSDLLRTVRLRGSMLTEDIDASMRVTLRGMKIASDPGLLSRELAPTRLRSLAGQRLRWAQGWTQVSLEYLGTALRSRRVTRRQKAGLLFMLGWRELYPWVSLQIVPLLAYALTHPREVAISWTIPIFVLSSLFALSGSPIQTILAYRLAAPNVRRHRNWFLAYPLWSLLFYEEFKNTITRVAHLKQVMGERRWLVTARSEEPLANKDTDEGVGVAPAETCPART